MSDLPLASHVVVIVIAWWLILFTLLPVGVKTHEESGEEKPEGTADSAPVNPGIKWKMLAATVGAFIFWGIFLLVARLDLITFR